MCKLDQRIFANCGIIKNLKHNLLLKHLLQFKLLTAFIVNYKDMNLQFAYNKAAA